MDEQHTQLAGHLLIAMPAMLDPNFAKTVTYVCEHSELGALGLVINRPMNLNFREVVEQLELPGEQSPLDEQAILQGGPIELQRGFVIHEPSGEWDATKAVTDGIFVTTSQDILGDMAAGKGPERAQLILGYAGWGPGQLEQEIAENAWLSVPASPQVVFDTPYEDRYEQAVALLGVDLSTLSSQVGHA